jgi:hypothetical protein
MPAPVNAWAVFENDKISLPSIAHDPETAKALFLGSDEDLFGWHVLENFGLRVVAITIIPAQSSIPQTSESETAGLA